MRFALNGREILEYTMVQNRKKHRHLIIHCPTSEGVSEASKGVSEVSEQANKLANERTDERVAQYFWFFLFLTIVR